MFIYSTGYCEYFNALCIFINNFSGIDRFYIYIYHVGNMGYEKRISKAEKDYVEIKKHVSGLITPVVGVLIVALLYNLLLFAFPFFGDNSMLFNVLAIGGNIFVMLILALTVVRWYYDRYYAKENTLVILTLFSTSEVDLIGRRFEVRQGIVDRMFNKGSIALSDAISVASDENSALILKNIKDPYGTIEKIVHV